MNKTSPGKPNSAFTVQRTCGNQDPMVTYAPVKHIPVLPGDLLQKQKESPTRMSVQPLPEGKVHVISSELPQTKNSKENKEPLSRQDTPENQKQAIEESTKKCMAFLTGTSPYKQRDRSPQVSPGQPQKIGPLHSERTPPFSLFTKKRRHDYLDDIFRPTPQTNESCEKK